MSIDKKSLALGFAIGGKFNCELNMEYSPKVWNDKGVYEYFYIDYKRAIGTFSYGRFRNASVVVGTTGEIIPVYAERITARVYKIDADISQEKQVRVFSTEGRGLNFSDGESVPGFGVSFWVDENTPHELPYIYDGATMERVDVVGIERQTIEYITIFETPAAADAFTLAAVPELAITESASVEYW